MKLIIPLFILTVLISSCSYFSNFYSIPTSTLTIETSALKLQFAQTTKLLHQIQNDKQIFTDEEWKTLTEIESIYTILIQKFDAISNNNIDSLTITDVVYYYELSKTSYLKSKPIILAHWIEFDNDTKSYLKLFDLHCKLTSERIEILLENPNEENIKQTLDLIVNISTSLAKVLTLIII